MNPKMHEFRHFADRRYRAADTRIRHSIPFRTPE
jgi:hypothetical protein